MAVELNEAVRSKSGIRVGMLLMVGVVFSVPLGDAMSKYLAQTVQPLEVTFWRYALQFALICCVVLISRQPVKPRRVGWLVIGGVSGASALLSIVYAFTVMPIATAVAIFFVEPLILTVLGVLFLGETAGWRRFSAIAVGLLGALVVIRPNWSSFGPMALMPMLAAFAYAMMLISMRKTSQYMDSLAIQFWVNLFAVLSVCVVMMLGLVFGFASFQAAAFPVSTWLLLLLMGAFAAVTFFMLNGAARRVPAGVLAPFQYLEIVGATIVGYVFFGDFPDAMTWLGAAIILASGLYVFHREQRVGLDHDEMRRQEIGQQR